MSQAISAVPALYGREALFVVNRDSAGLQNGLTASMETRGTEQVLTHRKLARSQKAPEKMVSTLEAVSA